MSNNVVTITPEPPAPNLIQIAEALDILKKTTIQALPENYRADLQQLALKILKDTLPT